MLYYRLLFNIHLKGMINKILIFILIIFSISCQKEEKKIEQTTGEVAKVADYIAEYGIPDQNLISPCSGSKELIRPIIKCINKKTNSLVNNSLCYSLTPIYMNMPSPNGEIQELITGGIKINACLEGSSIIQTTNYICNPGYFLLDNTCQSYQTVGNYIIQKDQKYQVSNSLKLLLTVGNDFSFKQKDNLKLFMLME